MAHIKQENTPEVGVMVGRFQVPELHEGHRDVLDFVASRHEKVILILGVPAHGISTEANPLDYIARKQMIEAEYPEFDFLYIKDEREDSYWSKKLDDLIGGLVDPMQSVLLYGSRDSFIPHYKGKFPTQELEAEFKVSGTQIRAEVKRKRPINSVDWRMAAVYTAARRFPNPYPTVDIAVFNEDLDQIVLIKKPNVDKWQLPGGFAESKFKTYEQDAEAEIEQETNLKITTPLYIGSSVVDDWRYRGEREKIKTIIYVAKHKFGDIRAGDDAEFAQWFKIADHGGLWVGGYSTPLMDCIMPNHVSFVSMAISKKDRLK